MSELSHYEKQDIFMTILRFFHLKDTSMHPIDFHYHDFHKNSDLSQRKYFLQCGRTYL